MALTYEGMGCALCGGSMDGEESRFSTSGDFIESTNPLSEYCDAVMHWSCYVDWEGRKEFARLYVQSRMEMEPGNTSWCKVYLDEDVYIEVNPHPSMEEVSVNLFETGLDVRVSLNDWGTWLHSPASHETRKTCPLNEETLARIAPRLRRSLPGRQAILDGVDWEGKEKLHQQERTAREEAAEILRQDILKYNAKYAAVNRETLKCETCGVIGNNRYKDGLGAKKSTLICKGCGCSFYL